MVYCDVRIKANYNATGLLDNKRKYETYKEILFRYQFRKELYKKQKAPFKKAIVFSHGIK
jgi:hypothetical protein